MEEKKGKHNTRAKILTILFVGIFFFVLATIARMVQNDTFMPYLHSWILIGSRGYYGESAPIPRIEGFTPYALELIGDSSYRHSDIDAALDAYRQAIREKPNTYIEIKIALLTVEKNQAGNQAESLSGSTESIITESISRIEKDASNREKYFGKGENYSEIPPFFEKQETNTIDW